MECSRTGDSRLCNGTKGKDKAPVRNMKMQMWTVDNQLKKCLLVKKRKVKIMLNTQWLR